MRCQRACILSYDKQTYTRLVCDDGTDVMLCLVLSQCSHSKTSSVSVWSAAGITTRLLCYSPTAHLTFIHHPSFLPSLPDSPLIEIYYPPPTSSSSHRPQCQGNHTLCSRNGHTNHSRMQTVRYKRLRGCVIWSNFFPGVHENKNDDIHAEDNIWMMTMIIWGGLVGFSVWVSPRLDFHLGSLFSSRQHSSTVYPCLFISTINATGSNSCKSRNNQANPRNKKQCMRNSKNLWLCMLAAMTQARLLFWLQWRAPPFPSKLQVFSIIIWRGKGRGG